MYEEELRDSIGQLERDLRTADKNRTGFLLQNDFEMVLRRNGGSSEQTEALTEQFRIGGSDCINYVELLKNMRSLAGNNMPSPTQESSSSNTVDTRSVSPISDENDIVNGAVNFPSREKRVLPITASTTSLRKNNSSNDNSPYNMMGMTKSGKRRDDDSFYTSRASTSSRMANIPATEESTMRSPFALSNRRESAIEKSKKQQQQQHEEEKNRAAHPHTVRDMKTSSFVEYAVERASSPVYRASSVEKMVQQAKLRAHSESSTPQQSETNKNQMMRGDSSEQRQRELFLFPNRERNNVSSAKQIQTRETPTPTPTTTTTTTTRKVVSTVKPTEDVGNSFSRSIHTNDRITQHNISRVSHGTSSTVGVSGRGDLISLREVFRVIDQNQDGMVTLREIWNALHRRGIEVHMPELEALADSLDLDESDMSDIMLGNGDDNSIDRVLSSVDFCMLVSRMRSSLIERIRRSSLWLAGAPEPSPPPVPPISVLTHKGLETTDKNQPHESAKWNASQSGTSLLAACEFTPSPRKSSSPHASYNSKVDVLSQDNVNSFSPPPSVHTSVTVTHLAESGITETPQGRSTIGTADHQPPSGSTVFVSPSPEMETARQPQAAPSMRSVTMPPSYRFTDVEKETEVISTKVGEQNSLTASRSESPHPYEVPIARGLQKDTEFSVPPPYLPPTENRNGTRSFRTLGGSIGSSSEKTNDHMSGKPSVSEDYAAIHRELLARRKQRLEEENFLRRLEMEFQERYSDLLNDTNTNTDPTHVQRFDVPDEMEIHQSDKSAQRVKTQREIVNYDTIRKDTHEVASRSVSSSRDNSPLNSNPGTVGRLFQHTASSLAHEREKKIKYIPPKRTTSLGRSSSSSMIQKSNEKGSRDDVESIDSLQRRRRSFSTSEESVSVVRQRYTSQMVKPQQKRQSLTTSVAGKPSMQRSGSNKNVSRGSIRNVQPISPSKGDVSTLSHHHYRTNSMESKSALIGKSELNESEPAVVRVSLIPDTSPLSPPTPTRVSAASVDNGRIGRSSSAGSRSPSNNADLSTQRQRMPLPGIPPLPPNRSRTVEQSGGEIDKVRHPQISKSISEKLYGKCSYLLSLCSNYDRAQDGFLTPKDLGRALYAVAPDLTESEISELLSMGLSQGKNGNRCHYVSLVGDLVVQESYVQLHERIPESNESNNKDNRNSMEDMVNGTNVIPSDHPRHIATPSSISHASSVNVSPRRKERGSVEDSFLEDRVKKGRLKMNRLVREELLKGCGGDYHLLRNAFFAHDDIRTGYLEEKVLRECLVRLFRTEQRLMPPWLLDRCVRLCRTPFEREMIAASTNASTASTNTTKGISVAAAPPPDSTEEEAARRRVHGIPEVLWTVLCDYRYLLEELRL
ncbi:calmodulin [Trypanosoma theileri]|uniref:Calmodulin n=1 Tax=Trypanosoma theileri TaxID=67003 RepID=A0A1X0NMG3_9TRYP|nr:calmodulin [Trypanosoma theileri]ORC85683.1 calmodulin [Trypanosoma theileri]